MDRSSMSKGSKLSFTNSSPQSPYAPATSMQSHVPMPVPLPHAPTLMPGQIPPQFFNNHEIPLPSFSAMTVQHNGVSGRGQSEKLFKQPLSAKHQTSYPALTLNRSAGPKQMDDASTDERKRFEQQRQQQKVRQSFQASKSKTTNSDVLMGQIFADIGFERSNDSVKQHETRSRPITPSTDPVVPQSPRERSCSLNITVQNGVPGITSPPIVPFRTEESVRAPDLNDLLTKFSDFSTQAPPSNNFQPIRPKVQPAVPIEKKSAFFSESQTSTNWKSLSGDLTSVFTNQQQDSTQTSATCADLPPWCFSIASLPASYQLALQPFQKRSNVDKTSVLTLLGHSGLSKSTLEHIWTVTCRTHTGYLTLPELCAAVGLVGLAQTNFDVQHLTIDVLRRISSPPQPQLSFTTSHTTPQTIQLTQQSLPQSNVAPAQNTHQFSDISLLAQSTDSLSLPANTIEIAPEITDDDFSDFVSATPSIPLPKISTETKVPSVLPPPPIARPPTTKTGPPSTSQISHVTTPQQLNVSSPTSGRSSASRKSFSALPPIPITLLQPPNAAAKDYSSPAKKDNHEEQGWGDWNNVNTVVLEPSKSKTEAQHNTQTSVISNQDVSDLRGLDFTALSVQRSNRETDIYAALRELAPEEAPLPPLPSWNIPGNSTNMSANPKIDLNSLLFQNNSSNMVSQRSDNFDNFLNDGVSSLRGANVISPEELSLEGLHFDSLTTDNLSLHASDSAPSLSLDNLDLGDSVPQKPERPVEGFHHSTDMQRTDVWLSALGVCTELLREGCKVFNSVRDSKMLLAVLAKTTEHINDLIEVYRIARRIYVAVRSFNLIDHQPLLAAIKSNEEAWANLVTFFSLAGIEPPPGSLDFKSSDRGAGDSATTSLCGLCLLGTDDMSGKQRRGSITYITAEVDGRVYHMPCANFWLNCVGDQLPGLDLK